MSLSAAVIDALVASGVTVEQLAAAMKAELAEQDAKKAAKREGNAERQRRFKARRASEVTPDNADNALPDVTPLKVSPHTPLPKTPESSPPISPRKKRGSAPVIEVPDWVPAEPWAAFEEMRQSMKHKWPWTPAAMKGTWDDLARFKADGHDIGALLMNSVKKGYRGVFAPDKPATVTQIRSIPDKPMTAEAHDRLAEHAMNNSQPLKADYHRRQADELRRKRA